MVRMLVNFGKDYCLTYLFCLLQLWRSDDDSIMTALAAAMIVAICGVGKPFEVCMALTMCLTLRLTVQ